jgi:hypothetical protein
VVSSALILLARISLIENHAAGDFAFSRKGMFKELFCHELNVRRYSNLESWLSKGKFAPVLSVGGCDCSLNGERTMTLSIRSCLYLLRRRWHCK